MVKQYQDSGWNTAKTAATLYEYDSFGNQVKKTLAMSDTPTKDNSQMSEIVYSVESSEDGVYYVTTQISYNPEGIALNSTQKLLISELSDILASKNISIDVRGNTSVSWTEYSAPAKLTRFNIIPTSRITAKSIEMDGMTLLKKDHAGIVTTFYRTYTATGMTLEQKDGRDNSSFKITDIAGRVLRAIDTAGHCTTYTYDSVHNQPTMLTDGQGNTIFYKYNLQGRKIAEWGTISQPACYDYDDMGNIVTLRTFRAKDEAINTDPSNRTDYDQTSWIFHPITGLELSKTYSDNSTVVKTYDAFNRLATVTDTRGNVKTYSYEHGRGLLLGITYTTTENTAASSICNFSYNHLGQITRVVDDAGVRTLVYNNYGELESDNLLTDGDTHIITENRDAFGRSIGYVYSKNGSAQQTVTTGYGDDGRIASAGFLHGGTARNFGYTYLDGTHLLHKLTKPNNMTLTQTYEATRDLLTGMAYHRGSTLVAQRTYTYDLLGRPTARNTARQGSVVNDTFAHNTRSELTAATVNGVDYEYAYDNIGNRQQSTEDNDVTVYDANALNQYTAISKNGSAAFAPQFDDDGNQTLVKTETGIWTTVYNAENRPVSFTNEESNTVVECTYDSMGRRAFKKVTVNGSVTLHQRYIYRGYVQIACIDLTRSNHPALWFITWDPTQRIDTRPLAIQKDGTWYTFGLDLTKNVWEIFGSSGFIRNTYSYTPYGQVISSCDITQPIQWSSEFYDSESALVYYNYRYYNPADGRWLTLDPIISSNLYSYCENSSIIGQDVLGLAFLSKHLATADLFFSSFKTLKDYERKKECFEFGNILPDVPIASLSEDITRYFMDENTIGRKIIDGVMGAFRYLYNLLFDSEDDTYSPPNEIAEDIIFHLSNISHIETLRSHFGDLASYHAMAMRGDESPESTFDNMVKNISEFILESHGSCACERLRSYGKIMHMMTDLHTESHAKLIPSNGKKIKVKHFYYYGYQLGKKHAIYDDIDEKDMRAAINTYKKVMYAIDNELFSEIKNKISGVIDISNATTADKKRDYKKFQ